MISRMQNARKWCWIVVLGVGLGCVLTGCGGEGYTVAPVSGTVTVNGKPTANVLVSFQPMASESNINPGPGSQAVTDASGHYELKLVVANEDRLGAVVGQHRVRFYSADSKVLPPDFDYGSLDVAPPKPVDSVLPPGEEGKEVPFEVPAGGTTSADFAFPLK